MVQETPAGKISSLHLLTSPGGGLATFIAPKLPVDRAAIEDYIRRHFVPAPETITLEQEEIQQSLWLHPRSGRLLPPTASNLNSPKWR